MNGLMFLCNKNNPFQEWLSSRVLASVLLVSLWVVLGWTFVDQLQWDTFRQTLVSPYTWFAVIFTLKQATLSTLFTVALGIPIARSIARQYHRSWVRWVERLCQTSFVLPSIVVVACMLALLGKHGIWAYIIQSFGFSWHFPYGLAGIVLAHLFLNLPLVVRNIGLALNRVPQEQWHILEQWNIRGWRRFWYFERHWITPALQSCITLVFFLCWTSFAIVLTLGGGPRATTIELAIFEAMRVDFSPSQAAALACIQILMATAFICIFNPQRHVMIQRQTHVPEKIPVFQSWPGIIVDHGWIILFMMIVIFPLTALVFQSASAMTSSNIWDFLLSENLLKTILRTLALGITVGLACAWICLGLARQILVLLFYHPLSRRSSNDLNMAKAFLRLLHWVPFLGWVVSPMILTVCMFLVFRSFGIQLEGAMLAIILCNIMMIIPIMFVPILHAMKKVFHDHHMLFKHLGLDTKQQWQYAYRPVLKPVLRSCIGIGSCLGMGDLTAVALFGQEHTMTLPWMLYLQLSQYRFYEASLTALILLALIILIQTCFLTYQRPRHVTRH